jgi:conjugal transfer pilus assembly protein TraK
MAVVSAAASEPVQAAKPDVSRAPAIAAKPPTKKPVAEQPMPGLGVMPGDKQALRANTVRVGGDRTEIIYVSASFPNRISTPFAAPRAIDKSNADITQEGQSLYVTLNDPAKAVALYITGDKPNDPVVSITLVPKDLPPQTVVLQLDASIPVGGSATRDEAPIDSAYEEQIRYVMRQAALGKAPEGFAEGTLPNSVARIGALIAVPIARYSGPHSDLYRYRVENAADAQVELDEGAFYSDNVRAVAFFPTAVLRKGESTFVFVLADKSATGN